jgi:hypothetical protein
MAIDRAEITLEIDGHVVHGWFQSPILLQWGSGDGRTRDIDVSLTQCR